MKKYIFICVVCSVIVSAIVSGSITYSMNHKYDDLKVALVKTPSSTIEPDAETYDEFEDRLYRERAIRNLSSILGELREIESLHISLSVHTEEMQDQFLRDLKNLTYFSDTENPYLKDFKITIDKETEPFYICREITMQVKQKLDDIMHNHD